MHCGKWASPWMVGGVRVIKGKGTSLSSLIFPLFYPRKADEGLASLSEDGRSPISIRQMAYGEPRERDQRRELDTPPPFQGNLNIHMC